MKKILLMVGIVCIFVCTGCGQEEKANQKPVDEHKETVESVKQKAGEAVEKTREKIGETAEGVKKKAAESAEAAKAKTEAAVEGIKETTEETVEDVTEKTGEAVETTKKTTAEGIEEAKKKTTDTFKELREKAEATLAVGSVGVLEMKNEKAFKQHRMGIVLFDHEKHVADKPAGYGLGCGKCHHDENGEPLTDLRFEDSVKGCFECHDKTGRPKRDPAMSPEEWEKEELKYYYGAIHENCMGCHQEMGGPKTCTECHPRPKRQ